MLPVKRSVVNKYLRMAWETNLASEPVPGVQIPIVGLNPHEEVLRRADLLLLVVTQI